MNPESFYKQSQFFTMLYVLPCSARLSGVPEPEQLIQKLLEIDEGFDRNPIAPVRMTCPSSPSVSILVLLGIDRATVKTARLA